MNQRIIARTLIILVLVVLILVSGSQLSKWLQENGPKAESVQTQEAKVIAEYTVLSTSDYTVQLQTQGQVSSARETVVAAEIAGKIMSVSQEHEVGGLLKQGEVLVTIDSADYQAALSSSLAAVADSELLLAQEKARADQALRDWSKLGRSGNPSDLVMRKPQLASAKARLSSAEAAVLQAERNLARTEVVVPYAARVKTVLADVGAYVVPGAPIAELVSSDDMEVRLPMSLEDYGFLAQKAPVVTLEAVIGGELFQWSAEMVRSEGQVDRKTMTVMMVAKVGPSSDRERFVLPPEGLFVKASWPGLVLENVSVVPRLALQTGGHVFLVGSDDKLERRDVKVLRTEGNVVVIGDGLESGDRVIVSPLGAPVVGMKLAPVLAEPKLEEEL